jgi:hypothetical protein
MKVMSQVGQLKLKRCMLEAMMMCAGVNAYPYRSDRGEEWYITVVVYGK